MSQVLTRNNRPTPHWFKFQFTRLPYLGFQEPSWYEKCSILQEKVSIDLSNYESHKLSYLSTAMAQQTPHERAYCSLLLNNCYRGLVNKGGPLG